MCAVFCFFCEAVYFVVVVFLLLYSCLDVCLIDLFVYLCLFILVPRIGLCSVIVTFYSLFEKGNDKAVWVLFQPFSDNSINVPIDLSRFTKLPLCL